MVTKPQKGTNKIVIFKEVLIVTTNVIANFDIKATYSNECYDFHLGYVM